jgi:hypothetical protein
MFVEYFGTSLIESLRMYSTSYYKFHIFFDECWEVQKSRPAGRSVPPGRTPQPHHNQPRRGWIWAELAGGWRCGIIFIKGILKKICRRAI